MKNRKLTYLLLFLVIVLWVVIIFRIASFSSSEPSAPVSRIAEKNKEFREVGRPLVLDYRDPFLEDRLSPKKPKVDQGVVYSQRSESVPENPAFVFKGTIRQGKKQYAILENNGISNLLQQGDVFDEFRLTVLTEDSVILKKGRNVFTLKAQ